MSEEIYRIPLAARWPGRVAAGGRSQDLVGLIDLAPTILDAAGTAFGRGCDGACLLGAMRGPGAPLRTAIVSEFGGLFNRTDHAHARSLVTGRHRYVHTLGDLDELYGLDEDPYQLKNLARSSEHAALRGELRARLHAELERTGDPFAAGMRAAS